MRDRHDYEDEYEDYELPYSSKSKRKGHQSKRGKSEKWDNVLEMNNIEEVSVFNDDLPSEKRSIKSKEFPNVPAFVTGLSTRPVITYGPNTHTIRNNQIDFDRVLDIQKTEGVYNGHLTFGITFFFKGKKRSSRTVWFSTNERERDSVYNTEVGFWKSLQK